MATPEFLPFDELVRQIAALCAQGKSGTVLLVSDDNRMAQVHLHQGQIVFVMCRGRRGRDALGIMRTMRNARLSIDGLAAVNNDGAGLPTASILDYLSGAIEQLPEAGAAGQAGGAAAPQAQAVPVDFLTPAVRSTLQAAMLRHIGPMAEIVCGEHFDSAPDLRALITALAAEIPGKDASARFSADVTKALGIAPN
jgi:hypothetical protein